LTTFEFGPDKQYAPAVVLYGIEENEIVMATVHLDPAAPADRTKK
jgi:hypothetical protein